MKLKKNIIIFGTSRSGKTTLAIKLSKKIGYSVIMTDPLVTAFEQSFPQLNINHSNHDGQSVKNIQDFLMSYLKSSSGSSKLRRGLNYIYEGAYFDLDALQSEKILERYIIIYLCCPLESSDDYYKMLKTFDKDTDWTYHVSDEELKKYCDILKESNDYFLNEFKSRGLKFYDTTVNRDKILEDIVKDLEVRIENDTFYK